MSLLTLHLTEKEQVTALKQLLQSESELWHDCSIVCLKECADQFVVTIGNLRVRLSVSGHHMSSQACNHALRPAQVTPQEVRDAQKLFHNKDSAIKRGVHFGSNRYEVRTTCCAKAVSCCRRLPSMWFRHLSLLSWSHDLRHMPTTE
jgi:hypothetical protein